MNQRRNLPARSAVSAFSESSDGLRRWVCLKLPFHNRSRGIVRDAHLSPISAMRPLLRSPPERNDKCVHVAPSSTTLSKLFGAGLFRAIFSTQKTRRYGAAARPFHAAS